jgi:hypothetical protein
MWGERQRNVLVRGKSHDVSVYQKSKSVWIAVGDYMGARITVQDRSESTALKRWQETASIIGANAGPSRNKTTLKGGRTSTS